MTPEQSINVLAQFAQVYITQQPPAARDAIAQVAQAAVNVLTEATKPKPPTAEPLDHG